MAEFKFHVRHDAFICVTWLIHMRDMTHSYVWHDAFICVTWRIHMCDMTHSYVWHDSFIFVTWLIHMRDMTHSYIWHDSFICVTCLMYMCDMTHSCVWHDSFKLLMRLVYTCEIICSYVWHDSFINDSCICVTWLNHTWDMTHSCMWHDLFIHDAFICVTWPIHTFDTTQSYIWHESFKRLMRLVYKGWRGYIGCLIFIGHFPQKNPIISGSFAGNDLQLHSMHLRHLVHVVCVTRLIQSLKLQVIFAKEPLITGLFCGKSPMNIRHPFLDGWLYDTLWLYATLYELIIWFTTGFTVDLRLGLRLCPECVFRNVTSNAKTECFDVALCSTNVKHKLLYGFASWYLDVHAHSQLTDWF